MGQAAERLEMREDGQFLRLHQLYSFNPLEFPISTRTPKRYRVRSTWIGHVPFAMCLVAMIKPRILVELGTHWGVSYCAFCQAVKEMRLDTRCSAVDTWQGDPHASFYSIEVLEDLKEHHDAAYSLFSELVQSTFDEARPRFEDKSIDLLHIDGFHSYEAVRDDFESWLPKMSSRGVVLFHDTEVRDREDFGVWRFWDEIKQSFPHFEFHHSYGLGVLAVGESVPDGLQATFGAPKAEADRTREYFRNLGDHLTELYDVAIQKSNLQEVLHLKSDECNRIQAELHARIDETHRIQAELHARSDECHRARAELHAKAAEVWILWGELAATKQYYGQLRFRAIDKLARRLARFTLLYRVLRKLVRASVPGIRTLRRALGT